MICDLDRSQIGEVLCKILSVSKFCQSEWDLSSQLIFYSSRATGIFVFLSNYSLIYEMLKSLVTSTDILFHILTDCESFFSFIIKTCIVISIIIK